MKPVISKVNHAAVAEAVARLFAGLEARAARLFTTIDRSETVAAMRRRNRREQRAARRKG